MKASTITNKQQPIGDALGNVMGILVAEGAGPVIPDMPLRYNKPPIALPAFFPSSSLSLSLPPPQPPPSISCHHHHLSHLALVLVHASLVCLLLP
jgi:hypothetical protein